MKKVIHIKKISFLLALVLVLGCSLCLGMFVPSNIGEQAVAHAAASTAHVKGFDTTYLTYVGDQNNEDIHIRTDDYDYGSYSMWSALYKYVCTEPDGSKTCYYYALIESAINSAGQWGKYRFFRNKSLDISVDFYSKDGTLSIVNYTPASSAATVDTTVTLGINGNTSALGGAISYSKTVSYDAVNLFIVKDTVNGHKTINFNYGFQNWEDGAMVSPNIGLVKERMVVIFGVENYNGDSNYYMNITTTATIFKDATWPRPNATLNGTIKHSY